MSQTDIDADQDFIAQALPAFISEAREQIESVEQLLLQLEEAPGDSELLDALFRCAHTVKGSAGIFIWTRWWGLPTTLKRCLITCAMAVWTSPRD